jgi:hypothetical protein
VTPTLYVEVRVLPHSFVGALSIVENVPGGVRVCAPWFTSFTTAYAAAILAGPDAGARPIIKSVKNMLVSTLASVVHMSSWPPTSRTGPGAGSAM